MGRPRQGWTIRWRTGRPAEVRFTHDGHEYNLGLGTFDKREAAAKAERIYTDTIRGTLVKKRRPPQGSAAMSFTDAGGEWLAESFGRLREKTRAIYQDVYLLRLAREFPTLAHCTKPTMERFVSKRLAQIQANTLRKELSVLRSVLQFAHDKGWVREQPAVPSIPKRAKGTRFAQRRRIAADPISPSEIDGILDALPEWSRARQGQPAFPIRARFILGYDLALRPEYLNRMTVPEHWSPGRTAIWIPAEHDKTGAERFLPLTARALRALESVAPPDGPIFGDHDYRNSLQSAARQVLDRHRADRFCGQHLRSAGLTHMAEINVVGAQSVAGHKQISTTAKYVKPSARAAADVIDAFSRRRETPGNPTERPKQSGTIQRPSRNSPKDPA